MTDYVQACREKILGYSARVEKRTFVLGGVRAIISVRQFIICFCNCFRRTESQKCKNTTNDKADNAAGRKTA